MIRGGPHVQRGQEKREFMQDVQEMVDIVL